MGPYFIDIKRRGTTPPTGPSIKWEPMTSRKRGCTSVKLFPFQGSFGAQ